jgi:hypothetical protein
MVDHYGENPAYLQIVEKITQRGAMAIRQIQNA